MRSSIATISLSGTLEDKLEAAAACGFDAVQIFDSDILYYQGTPASVREMVHDLGLAIDGYQSLRDFAAIAEGQEDAAFRKRLDHAERKLDVMAQLGAPLLLVPATTLTGSSADKSRSVAQLRALAECAEKRNIRIAYGPLAWAAHVRTLAAAWDIVQAVDHPRFDIFVSSFHALAAGGDPATVGRLPGARIATVQLADAPNVTIDPISKSRFYSCLPGEGDLDLAGFVRDLLRTGYAGSLTLNVMNDAFFAAPRRVSLPRTACARCGCWKKMCGTKCAKTRPPPKRPRCSIRRNRRISPVWNFWNSPPPVRMHRRWAPGSKVSRL